MNWWRSLRVRLIVTTTPALLLGLALVLVFISGIFETTVTRQFDMRLNVYLDQVAAVLGGDRIAENLQQKLGTRDFSRPHSGLYWQAQSDGGRMLRSRSLWDEKIILPTDTVGFDEVHTHQAMGPGQQILRVLERRVVSPDNGRWRIAVGADRAGLDQDIHDFLQALIRFALILLALVVLIALIQFSVLQRPVSRLSRAISKLQRGERKNLVGDFPSELDQLVGNLNRLSQHNEEIANNARMQATNLAHTIKTPVAILKNELGDLRRQNVAANWSVIDDNLHRIDKMSQFYLARAQVTKPRYGASHVVHVRPIVFGIVQAIRRLHDGEGIELSYRCSEKAVFYGDATDLEELLGNLLDNAAKWASRFVVIQCDAGDGGLRIDVQDDGPGIPEEHRAEILEPGKRLDDSVPGTGFGLAIAAELVRSYGGTLTLSDAVPRDGQVIDMPDCPGLRVSVIFPPKQAD